MKNKKIRIFSIAAVILISSGIFISKFKHRESSKETTTVISPFLGTIETFISTTGTVLPKNRLEIKPTVNGRIDKVLVKEGEKVKTGQILAWISSTERAALLDAARGQGDAALKYWEGAYKPISLLSPIDAEVIVATTQPGQTVTTSDSVVVLSDQLIVRAQVDETDIGKIRPGQDASISLDAYPDTKIAAKVGHVYYESKTVNNVTIYEVDLVPQEIPQFFRSGMNAAIDFSEKSKESILLVPIEALHKDKEGDYVLVNQDNAKEPQRRAVKPGISDDKNSEIISGVDKDDRIVITTKKYALPASTTGTNPFFPSRRR